MTLLPISASRTSDVLSQIRLVSQLNSDNASLEGLYDQLSTGRRVNTLSDDPAAAISAISLQASQEYSNQILRNTESAEGYLNVTDTVAADIDTALISARGTVVSAAQTPLSQAERDALADSLDQSIDRLIASANQTYRGHYVLGGAIDTDPPLVAEGTGVVWSGQPALQSTRISENWVLDTGINASEALGSGRVLVESNDLDPSLTRDTLLSETLDGAGSTPGVIRITSGSPWQDVDLRGAKTIGDIEDRLESVLVDDRALSVTLSNDGFSIDYADGLGGTLAIEDVGGGSLANDLGIERPQGIGGVPVGSKDLRPSLAGTVLLTDLDGGAGIDVSAGIVIQQGSESFEIDLSRAETIHDVVTAINFSDADVRANLNPGSGRIEIQALRDGEDYIITENGGSAASALGIRTSSEATTLAELDRGRGLGTVDGDDITIHRTDGSTLSLDVDSLENIGDVINAINTHVDNVGAATVTASLRSDGNGIQITSAVGTESLRVREADGTNVGEMLGLVAEGDQEVTSIVEGGIEVIRGVDFAPAESGSTLDTLIRLREAITAGDIREITRLAPRLDDHLTQSTRVRAEVGTRVQNIELVREQTEDFSIELSSQLSNQLDADFAQVISEVAARQASIEASLRVIGQISQLTVLNFL